MNTPIMLTPYQIIGIFVGACGVITATAAACGVIISMINRFRKPNQLQNARLDKHEQWLKKHDEMLDNDNKRLNSLTENNKMILKALYALLSHGIDGNDVKKMEEVRDQLNDFMIFK